MSVGTQRLPKPRPSRDFAEAESDLKRLRNAAYAVSTRSSDVARLERLKERLNGALKMAVLAQGQSPEEKAYRNDITLDSLRAMVQSSKVDLDELKQGRRLSTSRSSGRVRGTFSRRTSSAAPEPTRVITPEDVQTALTPPLLATSVTSGAVGEAVAAWAPASRRTSSTEDALGGGVPLAAPSVAFLAASPAQEARNAEIASAMQNQAISTEDAERLSARELANQALVFDLPSAGSEDAVAYQYVKSATHDQEALQVYIDSVVQDYLSRQPSNGAPAVIDALNILRASPGPDRAFLLERIRPLVDVRRELLRLYVEQLRGYYETINPPPENASPLDLEFKLALKQADVVNRDYTLDMTLLEDLRSDVGKLLDRTRPGFLRRAWSYTTGFLNPSRLKSRRAIALSVLAASLAAGGLLVYNPQLFSSLGIIGPDTASAISNTTSRIFSEDFFNALSSGTQYALRQTGAIVVSAKDYVGQWLFGGGAAQAVESAAAPFIGPSATASQIAEAARNASALVPLGGVASGATAATTGIASAAYNAFASIPSAVGPAASATYNAIGNWLTGPAPLQIAVPAIGAGVYTAYSAGQKLVDRIWSRQAVDAAEAISAATVTDLVKKSSRITGGAQSPGGGAPTGVTTEEFAEMQQKADDVDSLASQVAADAVVVAAQPPENTPLDNPLANPNIAAMVSDVDAMAEASENLKKTSERITSKTLNVDGKPKHMESPETGDEQRAQDEVAAQAGEKKQRRGASKKRGTKRSRGAGGKPARSGSSSSPSSKKGRRKSSPSSKRGKSRKGGSSKRKRSPSPRAPSPKRRTRKGGARPRRSKASYGPSKSRRSPSRQR